MRLSLGNDETHDAAWKVEVPIYVLVHINNERGQERMHGNWKENRYGGGQKLYK